MCKKFQAGIISTCILALAGCSNMPGTSGQQGAVIGGASGAAVGAAVAHDHGVGALIGGAVGALGGYVIGANKEKIFGDDKEGASEAARKSQETPATPDQARTATTADVNNDGYVTMDEVIALKDAGLTDDQMVDRLRASGQVFELTSQQQDYLREKGVSQTVIDQMLTLKRGQRDVVSKPSNPVVGRQSGNY